MTLKVIILQDSIEELKCSLLDPVKLANCNNPFYALM